jgi:hypothetical protein
MSLIKYKINIYVKNLTEKLLTKHDSYVRITYSPAYPYVGWENVLSHTPRYKNKR